jgi:peptidoglycan/LPS O-acetylase OafA/YrhL
MGIHTNPATFEKPQKLLVLEGLRGVAAMMVVLDHLHLFFFVEVDNSIETFLNSRVPYLVSKAGQFLTTGLHDGNFAVWVFWVMSAFVLSARYFSLVHHRKTGESRDYLFRSTVKRYPRLAVPILASTIFAYLLLSANLMTHLDLYARLGAHTSSGWLRIRTLTLFSRQIRLVGYILQFQSRCHV